LWRMEYPDAVQWWRLQVVQCREELWFFVGKRVHFGADFGDASFQRIDPANEDTRRLVLWLLNAIEEEVGRFLADPAKYNLEFRRALPLTKRYGRIVRRDLWRASNHADEIEREFASVDIDRFRELVLNLDEKAVVPEMSLSAFLNYCRICYKANNYPALRPSMTPMEMYIAMADGRDDGLLQLPPDDPSAFRQWYHHHPRYGHPFEICRGGNSTHISLSPGTLEDGWQLWLAGFSRPRVVETARMALALRQAGVPFVLSHKEEMLRMLAGEDFVGIVPDDVSIGYNHGEFPEEDRIHSFVHHWMIVEACGSVPDGVFWYPLDELVVNPRSDGSGR